MLLVGCLTNILFFAYKELYKKIRSWFSVPDEEILEIFVPVYVKARFTNQHFIASTNINDTVQLLIDGFINQTIKATISNAMDVWKPK
jgi:hypothetical protein